MSDILDKDTVIFNPSQYYKTPEDILHDQEILVKREDKVAALENWRLDLSLRRVAEEENMRPLSKVNPIEVRLEDKIIAALAKLNENPTYSGTKFGSI
jgi:hypothetical protein